MSEDLVLLELNARWNCDLPFGWVPITGPADNSDELEIYDLDAFIEWFDDDAIRRLLADTLDLLQRCKGRTFEYENFHSGFKNASAMAGSTGV